MENKTVYVFMEQDAIPALVGKLFIDYGKGKETYSFEYTEDWLSLPERFAIDPALPLFRGRQYPKSQNLFGVFQDASPDRWGKTLLQRQENILARKNGRKPKKLLPSDYLLGVCDEARMGALRFSLGPNEPFLSYGNKLSIPPFMNLRNLEAASRAFENDENHFEEKWIAQLLAPGSSLGGARPKATVRDTGGTLWLAKFPSRHDDTDVEAWEKTALDLAKMCDLAVPQTSLQKFSKFGSTLLVERFDRIKTERIHFSSAMTFLQKSDGDDASYLDIVNILLENSANPNTDLEELWKRAVFNILISNSDDHLRNHGFLHTKTGWRLSPLYDLNPTPYGDSLSLALSFDDATMSIDTAIETAPFYRLTVSSAKRIAAAMANIVKTNWPKTAMQNNLSRAAIEAMRPAFSLAEQSL
ncbi:MAG: type II toxin-antitoxin system HipA family toxin [Schwartzia sp.]|nr:type II toxin-antitoxin system HipA family toxin [Schwartzia sp. (in: firmicutes)]